MERLFYVAALAAVVVSASANAEDSALRIHCDDDGAGAEIFINDKFKGECPINVKVPEGLLRLRAHKNVDAEHEQIFEQELRVGGSVVQTINLTMPAPQLTEKAKLARQAEALRQLRQAAEGGNISAMTELSRRYDTGDGAPKDAAAAQAWHNKAVAAAAAEAGTQLQSAQAGNIQDMLGMASRYDTGNGVTKDPAQAQAWRNKAAAAKQEKAAQEQARIRQAQKEEKIDQAKQSFFEYGGNALKEANNAQRTGDSLASTFDVLISFPIGVALDIISTPFKMTNLVIIQQEAALRPATWGKPDSMIAKAAAYQQQSLILSSTRQPDTIVALK